MLLESKLKHSRFKHQKKLNETNLYLYKSITLYIQNSELRGFEKEEILQQIMDMMLQAQSEDKSMTLIIGHDYEEFCKSIIEEYNRGKSKTYIALNYMQKCLLWMTVISTFVMVLRGLLNSSRGLGITVDHLIADTVIALIMVPTIKKTNQENSSLPFLHQRLYIMNKGLTKSGTYGFLLMIAIVGLIRFILGNIFGSTVFNHVITLQSIIPYVFLILLSIGLIEVYKRMYNRS